MLHRRSFLKGLLAAPAIVHARNLMPIRGIPLQLEKPAAGIFPFDGHNVCYSGWFVTWGPTMVWEPALPTPARLLMPPQPDFQVPRIRL